MNPTKTLKFHGDGPNPLPPDTIVVKDTLPPAGPSTSAPAPKRWERESAAVQRLLGTAPEEAPLYLRCCPTLTWEERLYLFIGCYAAGVALSLSSIFSFPMLLAGDPAPFAWKYSIGNCIGIASSSFLVGPRAQLEQMASPVRLGATLVYLASILVTVVAALVLEHALLTLVAMVVQFCALAWYSASYIPFGRLCIRRCVGDLCCRV